MQCCVILVIHLGIVECRSERLRHNRDEEIILSVPAVRCRPRQYVFVRRSRRKSPNDTAFQRLVPDD